MRITVIVPSYLRPIDLRRCLEALSSQSLPANEVVVVAREDDQQTWDVLDTVPDLPLKKVSVDVPGVVAAMNAGLNAATGDILAFTDDDSAPHSDWLERIVSYFQADENIGGVGGRDIFQTNHARNDGTRNIVGKLQWYGQLIGEHHRGTGDAREVDVLKGVNMSFRRSAIGSMRFDTRMLGAGAQVHFEIAFSLALKRQNWKLIYDPKIRVDHYVAQRFDEDQRNLFNSVAFSNAVHNETLALLEHLEPRKRLIFIIWALFIGNTQSMGLIQWIRYTPSQGLLATRKYFSSMHGRWQGWQTWQRYQHNKYLNVSSKNLKSSN